MRMKNLFALLFLLVFSSCGYNPIFKNTSNSNDFRINIIKMQGDAKINNIIKKQLELKSNENSKKIYDVSLETNYSEIILAKDTSGAITHYQLVVNSTFRVNFRNQTIDLTFSESLKMKNISDSLEKLSYEKNIKNNFASSLVDKLIVKIVTLQ